MLQRHNDGVLYSSQFSKRAQPAIKRITRIRAPAEVIAHLMSVVGAQIDAASTSLLNFHQGFHHLIDRHVPFEQIGLVEIAPGISFGAAYVHEIHPVAEFARVRIKKVGFCTKLPYPKYHKNDPAIISGAAFVIYRLHYPMKFDQIDYFCTK